jgi:hypothetical protein
MQIALPTRARCPCDFPWGLLAATDDLHKPTQPTPEDPHHITGTGTGTGTGTDTSHNRHRHTAQQPSGVEPTAAGSAVAGHHEVAKGSP